MTLHVVDHMMAHPHIDIIHYIIHYSQLSCKCIHIWFIIHYHLAIHIYIPSTNVT